jgi:hypothetical protein
MTFARNGTTGEIEFGGRDASAVIQKAIDAITSGKIVLKEMNASFTNSVVMKPGVSIWGLGTECTKITAPSGKPAFTYTQTSGGVVFKPIELHHLRIILPSSGGPHFGIKVDCSYYGGTNAYLEDVVIDGWNASGTYDKNSSTPHVGIEFIKVWRGFFKSVVIVMPGICMKLSDYHYLDDCYFDGGMNGESIGVLYTAYATMLRVRNLVTEVKCNPVFKSNVASFNLDLENCHFEYMGWGTPVKPILELDYPSGTWEVLIRVKGDSRFAMKIYKAYSLPIQWFHREDDITGKMLKGWQYSVVSGSPTVTFAEEGIKVISGSSEGIVDLWVKRFSHPEVWLGCYLKGEGEARFIDSYLTSWLGIGIDSSTNLFIRHKSPTVDETQVVDTGYSEYDLIGNIAIDKLTKYVVYWKNGVVYSKQIAFANGITLWNCDRIRIVVPANKSLTIYPHFLEVGR